MMKYLRSGLLTLGFCLMAMGNPVQALPGQLVRDVEAWIRAHPTLQPGEGESLRVRKSDTAAQRFEFEASLASPGELAFVHHQGRIRSESLEFFDAVNGVTIVRLEESLRVIYGVDIYQDYSDAEVVYAYPQVVELDDATDSQWQEFEPLTPLEMAQQGQVRLGDRYAYWLEITANPDGIAYSGHVVVFLPEDLDKLQRRLGG